MSNSHCSRIYHIFPGYYGESVPSDSGLLSIIKAHGSLKHMQTRTAFNLTAEQIFKTNGSAVVLVRNPFRAIYGYRHLQFAGHTGHTNSSQFIGPGRFTLFG